MLRTPTDIRRILENAGYAWDEMHDVWVHPQTKRALAGGIARTITPAQVAEWVKADDKKPRGFN